MLHMAMILMLVMGCTRPHPGPTAILRFTDPSAWTAADREYVADGVVTWQALGFVGLVDAANTLPPCPNDWYARTPPLRACAITIAVSRETGMMENDKLRGAADRDRDLVIVDTQLHGLDLAHVIAHEVGHILLNTAKHSTAGVMLGGGWDWMLSDDDKALACASIQLGCP